MVPRMKKPPKVPLGGIGGTAATAVGLFLDIAGLFPDFPKDVGIIAAVGFMVGGGAGVVKAVIDSRRDRGAFDT